MSWLTDKEKEYERKLRFETAQSLMANADETPPQKVHVFHEWLRKIFNTNSNGNK